MDMKLNETAMHKAKSLIASRQYVLESSWSEAQPSAEDENDFLDRHGWKAYGEWHLTRSPRTA
jgi:hypothetical protein